jgi:hypothetical protein
MVPDAGSIGQILVLIEHELIGGNVPGHARSSAKHFDGVGVR